MSSEKRRMDEIFISDTAVKKQIKLKEDFLRPAYQYTSIEIVNWGREKYYKSRSIN